MTLQAISVIQPWAWLLLRPDVVGGEARAAVRAAGLIKDVENRDWSTHVRGWVLLHASGTRLPVAARATDGQAKADWQSASLFAAQRGVEVPLQRSLPHGELVGAIRIDACESYVRSRWFVGKHGLVIGAAVAFAQGVPMKGALKFFPVPPVGGGVGGMELAEAVAKQIRGAGLATEFKL